MELEYVLRAMRRFWPVVLCSMIVGLLGAFLLISKPTAEYASRALVVVRPTDGADLGITAGDRYISSQLIRLEAPPMAAKAAQLADVDLPPDAIKRAVSFYQIPGTDVVRITAVALSPRDAQAIANSYLDAFIQESEARAGTTENNDREQLDRSIADIEQQLTDLDERISDMLEPYRDATGEENVFPTIEVVAPALATARQVKLDTYRELLLRQVTLDSEPQAAPNDLIIQRAELPRQPTAESSRLVPVGFAVATFLLGVGIVVLLARTSPKVLDAQEVTETLGVPFAGVLPHSPALETRSLASVVAVPDDVQAVVNNLCVHAEALGSSTSSLTVLVAGSQRNACTSTLAALMAARFGERGARVTLVDLDLDNQAISTDFGVVGDGFAAALSRSHVPVEGQASTGHFYWERLSTERKAIIGPSKRTSPDPHSRVDTPTRLDNVCVVGRKRQEGLTRPRRIDIETLVGVLNEFTDVVVIDAGPMLSESAGAVLADRVDAIVLTVPVRVQRRSRLVAIARYLTPHRTNLLPVDVPKLRSAEPEEPSPKSSLDLEQRLERDVRVEERVGTIA